MKVSKCTIDGHRKRFGTENQCRDYLTKLKWPNGFKCKKCANKDYITGRLSYYRRCTKCKYDESVTSGTIFHSCKLPLVKVFEIVYRIAVNKKGLSGLSIAREYGVNQKTADLLRKKIQSVMASSEKYSLLKEVHVDDFFIGGKDKSKTGKTGRSSSTSKERACIAVEITTSGIGRAYIKKINDFSTASLRPLLETFCPTAKVIITDGWAGYKPLKKEFPTMQTKLSEHGKNSPELHTVIMLFKKFIKGIHHNVSSARLQNYMDEFCYRFNRKSHLANINKNLLNRMALSKPYKHPEKPNKL